MKKHKQGFTLAEVLITLVIIGVIAAMTIPTLMNSTNNQEFRVGLKKAISTLNQAMSLNYALEGTKVDHTWEDGDIIDNIFKKRLNVITTGTSGTDFAYNSAVSYVNDSIFYTADGMRFAICMYGSVMYVDELDDFGFGTMLIDVNGDKGPNTVCTNAEEPTDTYIATIFGNRIVLGDYISSPDSLESNAAKQIIFDKKTTNEDVSTKS